ncbi:hypothetical protein ACQ4XT_11475 [Halobacillus faecis]
MFETEFSEFVNEFGVSVHINEESRKVIISSKTVNEDFDDREIHTDFNIKRGDIVQFDNGDWIVISEVAAKRSFEYKAIIRPCNQAIGVVTTEQVFTGEYDPMNRPIYDTVETTTNVPAFVDWQRLSIEGTQIRLSDTDIDIVVQDNETTSTIVVNDEFDLIDKRYAVQNINKFKQGLLILRASVTS